MDGVAQIKPEFVWKKLPEDAAKADVETKTSELSLSEKGGDVTVTEGLGLIGSESEPEIKRVKLDNGNDRPVDSTDTNTNYQHSGGNAESKRSQRKRGQNKAKDRPRPKKEAAEEKLCSHLLDGPQETECPYLPGCSFMHDVEKYLSSKVEDLQSECYLFTTYGKCPRGLTCRFSSSHIENGRNLVNEELWSKKQVTYEQTHCHLLPKSKQIELRKHRYDFKPVEKIWNELHSKPADKAPSNELVPEKKLGPVSDEDLVPLRKNELKNIDWTDKLYLSPLTTVGNLPFRRLCVEYGADVTCSEMSLATSLLQGNTHEFALHRRHPSEKLWGVQLCSNNGFIAAKAAHVLQDCGIDYDFVDLNMGCPIDAIYRQGAGSGLMCRVNKFQTMVKSMVAVLKGYGKPFTVKMRRGVTMDKNIAHNFISYCRDAGVSLVTLHGRSREQRYLKSADWSYIAECVKLAGPMPVFGNGDILSWEDYNEKRAISNAPGVMIGRGALMKPWIFQEIKEQRHIDMTSAQRMEILQKYVNYGLDHWGSDNQGIATTRRFLLEFLSFFHRYIPVGVLECPPQRINQRPPRYFGRDEVETLLTSGNAADWIKISEKFLGPVPSDFIFVPKHKASSW